MTERRSGVARLLAAALAVAVAMAGTVAAVEPPRCPGEPADARPIGGLAVTTLMIGGQPVRTELARTGAQRAAGLMHRASIASNEAMLFVFEQPQPARFWNQNVRFAIDVAWLAADGTVEQLVQLLPCDPTPRASRSATIRYALETAAGRLAELGVQPGTRIVLPPVIGATPPPVRTE